MSKTTGNNNITLFVALVLFIVVVITGSNDGRTCVEAAGGGGDGSWELLVANGGVSAMHMTLTPKNTVVMYDRTDYGPSQIKLPAGTDCRNDPKELALKVDCYAHSIELDLATNAVRPLRVLTDTWCSSASFLSDGTLVSTGGWNDGSTAVRLFAPCASGGTCDWNELQDTALGAARWYASNQILPDNTVIVVGGRRSFSYEFFPPVSATPFPLPFLAQTNEPGAENNLYPFLHLSSDGNLFIFANAKSVLLDYRKNQIVRTYPDLPGGSRNYPSSGSSAMLPLSAGDGFQIVEVMVCGGSPAGAWQKTARGTYAEALGTCGRMVITDPQAAWRVESMPGGRVMGDMIILPTSEILIVNGAEQGTAGWGAAATPALAPFLYDPRTAAFRVLAASAIPRMYHSSAVLLPDGRVLVGGSNTNPGYAFSNVPFPTELRLEAFHPYYLDPSLDPQRPLITAHALSVPYSSVFEVDFSIPQPPSAVEFKLYAPSFSTHSTQMNQRQLILQPVSVNATGGGAFKALLQSPPTPVAAPPGYYLFYAVNGGVPSSGVWIRVASN